MPSTQKAKSVQLPKSWPKSSSVTYIFEPIYSPKLDASTLSNLHAEPACGSGSNTSQVIDNTSPGPSSLVFIRAITNSPNHPANNQHGLFATRKLAPGSFILFYIGYVHHSSESDPDSNYDLSMDAELQIAVDGAKFGNEARFINDFRGIVERANAEFKDVWVRTGKGLERRVGVYAVSGKNKTAGIAKGEEILVSYGKGFWGARKSN